MCLLLYIFLLFYLPVKLVHLEKNMYISTIHFKEQSHDTTTNWPIEIIMRPILKYNLFT